MPRNGLGSIIASYNHHYKKSTSKNHQHEISNIIKRLEGYKKYQDKVKAEKYEYNRGKTRKLLTKLKKASYKKAYSFKPVINPYVEMMKKLHTPPDPNLLTRYKTANIYSMYEFRHLKLPKSNNQLTAAQGWSGLIKAWKGYKISKHLEDGEKMKKYASATQRFAHILQVPYMPDFPDIGLSAMGFNNAKALKEYFIGFENELEF